MKSRITFLICFICQCCLAQHWHPLGTGLDNFGGTTAMFSDTLNDKLYVAGPFTTVDNKNIWGIASWNDTWDSLGHGLDQYPSGPFPPGNTWGMAHLGNYLYAGGSFEWAGNGFSKYLSRWDGSNWSTIPGGLPNSAVDDVLTYNNDLYICGVFDSVGNVAAHGIARWDGASWHAIGPNYNFTAGSSSVLSIAFYNGNLYAAGDFTDPLGNTCRLAKWDGTTWQFMTNDLRGAIVNIWDMEVYNNELYVSGLFYMADGNAGNCIVRWNDTTWRDVGGSVDFYSFNVPQVRDMVVHNGKLFCAGNFEKVGGIMAMGLASWDGINWCGYNTSFVANSQECGTYNLAFYHDTLYVSGGFGIVEGDTINYIAQWIGGNYVDQCGNTTGISESEIVNQISVFPNPSNGEFLLTGNFPAESRIEIYDMLGEKLSSEEIPKGNQSLNLRYDLAAGIYFCKIISEDQELKSGKMLILK